MKRLISAVLMLIIAFTVCIGASFGEELTEEILETVGTIAVANAAIRAKPTKAVPPLINLSAGETVTVTGIISNGEGNWLYVGYKERGKEYKGFMLMDYVTAELKSIDGDEILFPVTLRVSATAVCVGGYNHVGYNWTKEFYIDGKELANGTALTLKAGDSVRLGAIITESDANPDAGSNYIIKTVSQEELDKGFKVEFEVYVSENRGRYSGYGCRWLVTFYLNRA